VNYFRTAGTAEITSTLLEETLKIHTAIGRSRNIKGTISDQMKDATAVITAAITTLQQRADDVDAKGELEELAKQLRRERRRETPERK